MTRNKVNAFLGCCPFGGFGGGTHKPVLHLGLEIGSSLWLYVACAILLFFFKLSLYMMDSLLITIRSIDKPLKKYLVSPFNLLAMTGTEKSLTFLRIYTPFFSRLIS